MKISSHFYWVSLVCLALSLGIAMVACQTETPAPVEVTRLIEVTALLPPAVTTVEPDIETIEVTRIVTQTLVETDDSTAENEPIQFLFLPTETEGAINGRGGALGAALERAVDKRFEIIVSPDRETAIQQLCQEGAQAIAFLPAPDSLLALETCQAQPMLSGVRFDVPYHAGMYVVRAGQGIGSDEGLESLETLPQRRLGIGQEGSVTYDLLAHKQLADAGISISETVYFEGDANALRGLLADEIDIALVAFNPPLLPEGEAVWRFGEMSPEIWRFLGLPATRSPIGYVEILGGPDDGGYRIRDARAILFDTTPTIFDDTRIVALTSPTPNGMAVFSPGMPLADAVQISQALQQFAASDNCLPAICSPDFYNWEGMMPAISADLDPLRQLNIAPEDLAALREEF